jgi:hypothetical protein
MSDDGSTKDDVKLPDGEVGDKINKLFTEENKDTSKFAIGSSSFEQQLINCRRHRSHRHG